MLKNLLTVCFLAFMGLSPSSIKASTIVGFLYYEGTNLPIVGAKIYSVYTGDSALSDRQGWFSLKVDSMEREELEIEAAHCYGQRFEVANRHHHKLYLRVLPVELPELRIIALYDNHRRRQNRDIDFHRRVAIERRIMGPSLAWLKEIIDEFEYTPIALEMGVEGRIFLQFSIAEDGSFKDFKLMRGVLREIDQKTLAVFQNFRNLSAEEYQATLDLRGIEVQEVYIQPIRFQIEAK